MTMKRLCSITIVLLLCGLGTLHSQAKNELYQFDKTRYWIPESIPKDQYLGFKAVPLRTDPKIVILMYHNLVFGRTGNEYNRDLYNFEQDIRFIQSRFKIIDFYDLNAIQAGKQKLETDAAVITFDDGDLSMYAIAYPLLSEYDIKATFFIISGFVGEVGYMSWDQITQISRYRSKSGKRIFSIGSHSATHKYLNQVGPEVVYEELRASKKEIEQKAGTTVDFISLPFGDGHDNATIRNIAKELGYFGIRTSVETSIPAAKIDMYSLPSATIRNASTDKEFERIWKMIGR